MKKPVIILVVMGMALVFTTMLFAAPNASPADQDGYQPDTPVQPVADMKVDSTQIAWVPQVEGSALVLTISGPNGLHFQQEFVAGKQLTLDLTDEKGLALPDGGYNYELYAIPAEIRSTNESRDRNAELQSVATSAKSVKQSGYFTIDKGAFVLPTADIEQEALTETDVEQAAPNGQISPNAQVYVTDLIVQGSSCVGIDCSTNESFGFDTLRLKENNLRIHFDDTSSSASFPSTDWRLTANDSTNGGQNKFSIDDATSGTTPFTVEGGTPSNTLYVDAAGRIGVNTNSPVVGVHHVDGNSPTLRLEQDGSDGFSPQTWDIAGNETNFFIRDVTNGSKLPFRIEPNSPQNSIYIDSTGDVGFGTQTPDATLEVEDNDGSTQILVKETNSTAATRTLLTLQNNGVPQLQFKNSNNGDLWTMAADTDGFYIQYDSDILFRIDQDGNLIIVGEVTDNGDPESKAAKDNTILQQQEHIETLEARLAELEVIVDTLLSE